MLVRTSSSEDVYPTLSQIWNRGRLELDERSELAHKLEARLCDLQESLVKLWSPLESAGHFITAWLILGEVERKRHVLKGIEEAYDYASQGKGLPALSPEITLKLILKEQGEAFKGFIITITRGRNHEQNIFSQMHDGRRRWIF